MIISTTGPTPRAPSRIRVSGEAGFTLIEMLVATALVVIVSTAIVTFLTSAIHSTDRIRNDAVIQTEVRSVVDQVTSDLRSAYTGTTVAPIESMSPTSITFYTPDRASPLHLRRITYQLVNGEFGRSLATSTNTDQAPWLIPVQGPWLRQLNAVASTTVFTYFDKDGALTTDPTTVRTINITLAVSDPGSPGRQLSYGGAATLRNTQ